MVLRGAACAQQLSPFMEIWMSPFTRIACLRSVVRGAATACAMLASAATSAGEAVQWKSGEGGNGHWYQLRTLASQANWTASRQLAESSGGYLATPTSAGEDQFIRSTLLEGVVPVGQFGPHIGGFRLDGTAQQAACPGWQWISGEPFSYIQNDLSTDLCQVWSQFYAYETRLQYWVGEYLVWNNCDDSTAVSFLLVEWSADCNNDGIVDYGQCRDGSLPDYNGNNIPDCCEQGTSCVVGNYPVQWRVEDGGNGHWYARRSFTSADVSHANAAALADAEAGSLATVLSQSEGDVLRRINRYEFRSYWIGGVQVDPSCGGTGCEWRWTTGEPWGYENWCCGGDNDVTGSEDCLACSEDGLWNSVPCSGGLGMEHYMVEWSADCDGDGVVDYGQILNGALADKNANGVPDACDTLHVPAEFPTIQAAIDAAHPGALVLVAPGSYAPFDFRSKRVEVRSTDGAASTMIDAAGMPTSAVTFGSRSTFETTIRGFTILTGSGTVYPQSGSAWRAGGGCYLWGDPTDNFVPSATIEDCRFIGSSGGCGYGAGVWTRVANVAIRRCLFDGTNAEHHGPAVSLEPMVGVDVPGAPGVQVLIEDCAVRNTSSYNNGGILVGVGPTPSPVTVQISRCEFESNHGSFQSGALLTGGDPSGAGGIVRVERCVFRNNGAPTASSIGVGILGGTPSLTLMLQGCVVADPSVAVRLGTGAMTLQDNFICAGAGAVQGPWSDAGGNQFSCPAFSDCDGDGRDDLQQIVLGLGVDADGDGALDGCVQSLRVPQDYPTIQSAIDAVGPGTPRIVAVAPGTYNESFSLNGKDVIVRGAPNGSTILDGAGLTTSIARFAGNEPATAGVENLVFRNGTAGSRLYEGAKFTVGGALFGADSAAFIRGCRFEQNRADFGGAVYLIHSQADMLDCMFTGNTGRTDGGGAMLYECAGSVRASDFTGNACATAGSGNGGAFKSVGGRTEGAIVTLEGCGIASTSSGSDGAAVHHFENLGFGVSGVLRIVDSNITGNSTVVGAAGLSVDGRQSACVLAGSTAICANTPRNVEGAYLIEGAVTVCDCLADLTGDGSVDGADLGILLNSWGLANAQGDGDVNHDGAVNGADLGALLSSWGGCPG